MEVQRLCFSLLFFASLGSWANDEVSQDMGAHQVERLVTLLTRTECRALMEALSRPEESINTRLERLAPENNDLLQLSKRAVSRTEETEGECKAALVEWLLENGEKIFYDRLTRSLQHIGRTDVALEVAKNINQDILLNLKRYVTDYHKMAVSFNVPDSLPEAKTHRRRRIDPKGADQSWREKPVLLQRTRPGAPYDKGPLGIIMGLTFGIAFGLAMALLIWCCT